MSKSIIGLFGALTMTAMPLFSEISLREKLETQMRPLILGMNQSWRLSPSSVCNLFFAINYLVFGFL